MRTMKTTVIVSISIMHSQILSWNPKTSFYQLLFLDCQDPLPFLVKTTRSLSHLHNLFDATKLRFHLPKTGSISRASWTFTQTMIPRVGPGGVSSKSVMSPDNAYLQNSNPHPKKILVSHVQPSCISCAYILPILTC